MSNIRFQITLLCVIVSILALVAAPASAQIVVKNEDVTFQFGVQRQLWGDWTQDATGSQGYQQNTFGART
jgi:hypothetical protein